MPNPSAAEKLASQLGWIYVATVMPLMSGANASISQMAHVQGYYSGIAYAPAATGVAAAAADYVITFRYRGRH